jgi:hypothetical protein
MAIALYGFEANEYTDDKVKGHERNPAMSDE